MRTTVNHTPPAKMQAAPLDNTSAHVLRQVNMWLGFPDLRGVPVIHTQSAMEIAAWYHAPGNAFSAFSHTGTITEDLLFEIQREIQVGTFAGTLTSEDTDALRALRAYVQACR